MYDVKETCFEKYRMNIKLNLRNHVILNKFQDKLNNESLLDLDYFYAYKIGSFLTYHIVFFPKDNQNFTFKVTEIKNNSKETVFKINEDQTKSLIKIINNELMNRNFPYKEKVEKSSEEMFIDDILTKNNLSDSNSHFQEVIKIIKNSIQNNLQPFFFKKLQDYLEKFINKQYKNIANLKLDNDEIIINFNFEQKFDIYFIRFSKYSDNNKCFIKIIISHKFHENTFIHNYREILSFNELNEIDFDLKISEALMGFYKNQYDRILSNLQLFECNELEVSYQLIDNKIFCYISKDFLLFSLFIDNKGALTIINESKLFNQIEKNKILDSINLINCSNFNNSLNHINVFYLYIYNIALRKYYIMFPECTFNSYNEIFKFDILLFENIFQDYKKKSCLIQFQIQLNRNSTIKNIKKYLIIFNDSQESRYERNSEMIEKYINYLTNPTKINFNIFEKLYLISLNFKRKFHSNIQILFEVMNYGKVEVMNCLNTIVMKNIEPGLSNDRDFQEFLNNNDNYERLEINLSRCLSFKIVLTSKFVINFNLER